MARFKIGKLSTYDVQQMALKLDRRFDGSHHLNRNETCFEVKDEGAIGAEALIINLETYTFAVFSKTCTLHYIPRLQHTGPMRSAYNVINWKSN
jgi:hypothetical protein